MKKTNIIKNADTIIKYFFKNLEAIKNNANDRTILIYNEESEDKLTIKISYMGEKPLIELNILKINEDVYNYIITNIFMYIKDKEKAIYFVDKRFNIEITGEHYKLLTMFKGITIFLFDQNYQRKHKFINMLKSDMKSTIIYNIDDILLELTKNTKNKGR